MNDSQVELHADLENFFGSALERTLRDRSHPPSPIVRSYLLGVLSDGLRAHPTTLDRETPLVVHFESAWSASPTERFERLRVLGDSVLLVHGFFDGHGADDERYVEAWGARAYRAASSMLGRQPSVSDVLLELADGFGRWIQLLRDVAATVLADAARLAGTSSGCVELIRLCEQWLRHGSEHAAALLAAQGVRLAPGRLVVN